MKQTLRLHIIAVLVFFSHALFAVSDSSGVGKKRFISLSSGITVSAQYYRNWGADPRQQPFMYSISGAPALDIGGVSMPFSVIYSNQAFSFQQPFNQFGLAPRFKWGTVFLGTSSVRFSNYTLAGQRFMGAGADLQLGKFRLGGMYGRLRRAVFPLGNLNDPQTFLNEAEAPAFKRNGYTFKLGFGTKENFFDVIWFRAWDVAPDNYSVADWPLKPKENVVVGINSQFKLGKKVTLKNDWAVSALTRDINADTLEIENGTLRDLARKVLLPRTTTSIRIAGESSIRYNHKIASPSLSYKRIEHDFTSLGAYFFLTDIQQITGGLQLNLFKKKLSTNLSYGRQRDNLQGLRLRTSTRNIGAASVQFNPSAKWGMSLNYSNFGISQSPLPKALTDTSRINQVNNSLTFIPRLNIQRKNSMHSLNLVLGYAALTNLGASIGASAATTSYNANLSYNWQLQPLFFSAGITPSIISTETILGTFRATGASFNAGKGFMKGKWMLNYALSLFGNTFNGSENGRTTTHLLSLSGNIPRWPGIALNIQHINNTSNNLQAAPSFRELYANLSISYNF